MTGYNRLSYCWFLIVAIVFTVAGFYLASGIRIETNILKLIPEHGENPLILKATELYNNNFSRQIFFLVGAENQASSKKAATTTLSMLKSSDLFEGIIGRIDEQQQMNLYRAYEPYQASLITADDRKLLEENRLDALKERVLAAIISPGFSSKLLEQDPLLFFANFLNNMSPGTGNMTLNSDMIGVYHKNRHYTLVGARIKDDPFSLEYQNLFSEFYRNLKISLKNEHQDIHLISVGIIHNAIAGAEKAQKEVSLISSGSLIGILVIFIISFRSTRPILYALIPVLVGIVTGTVVCLTVYGTIHIMTLVFSTSLIGVSIDYSLHFFADRHYRHPTPPPHQALINIMPGITLGLISTLTGYAAFFITSFPGLQQMALFSATGLISAYCCVLFWFPRLPHPSTDGATRIGPFLAGKIIGFWSRRGKLQTILILSAVALFAVAGISITTVDDNIRSLDNTPPDLREYQENFESITGIKPSGQFFLVAGETIEEVLQREEVLSDILREQTSMGNLQAFSSTSSRLPSIKQQYENYRLVKASLAQEGLLIQKLIEIGYDTETIEKYKSKYAAEPEILSRNPLQGLNIPGNVQLMELEGQYISLVSLIGVKNIDPIVSAANGAIDSVYFVDQASDVSRLFMQYRQRINNLVVVVCFTVFLIFAWRYGAGIALKVITPPLLAAAVALAAAGYSGQSLNIFNSLALLLILGIGVDYSIFLAESKGHHESTMTGALYSAITTILSFGLLGLSSTPALKSIGTSAFFGIATALLLAPLVISGNETGKAETAKNRNRKYE